MKAKPDEHTLIAYLYDELDERERMAVEEYVATHPEVRAELDQLARVRGLLGMLPDKEVIAPPLLIMTPHGSRLWQSKGFKTFLGIAASVVIVMLAGRILDVQIEYRDSHLTMSFGRFQEPPTSPSLTAGDVQDMIDASLEKNNEAIQANWQDAHQEMAQSIRKNLVGSSGVIDNRIGQLVQQASLASQDQIRSYASSLRDENKKAMRDYMQLTSAEQKQYLESLLEDFAKYLQQQRSEDLRTFQTRLNDMEQNNSAFRKETEQLLSGIISTVSYPDDQIKN